MIKTLKQGLGSISGDLIGVINDILPATSPTPHKNTFKLLEAKLSINGNWDNGSSGHDLTCSNCYLHETGDSTEVTKLRFGCDCPVYEGSHDSELEYQGEY